jgi:hypothetical protein
MDMLKLISIALLLLSLIFGLTASAVDARQQDSDSGAF